MKSNKILILGNGLLGQELHKQTNWDIISRQDYHFDFNNLKSYKKYLSKYNIIINCIAYTKTYDKNKYLAFSTNYKAVMDLADYCNKTKKKLIHISSDYVYGNNKIGNSENDVPVHAENWYSYSKLLADSYIEARSNEYLIIRCTHKPFPFPYQEVVTQTGNFDYVHTIAEFIILLIEKNAKGIYNVGTEIKTMYELASKSRNDLKYRQPIDPSMPYTTVMNCNKLNNFLKENKWIKSTV
jgi:dTDP-4-dehydrorhamnose reductase